METLVTVMQVTIPVVARGKLWRVRFTPIYAPPPGEGRFVYDARAFAGRGNYHLCQWSIPHGVQSTRELDEVSVVAWYIREYRADAETILAEDSPRRQLTDLERYKPVNSGIPGELVRREIEDISIVLALVVEDSWTLRILKPSAQWPVCEQFLRDNPSYEQLVEFYQEYDRLVADPAGAQGVVENLLVAGAHVLHDLEVVDERVVDSLKSAAEPEGQTVTIFYSWQSDLPGSINREFIAEALDLAAQELRPEIDLTIESRVDADTQEWVGASDGVATILKRIDKADAFVADMSLVNPGHRQRVPDPGVLFELGYAVKVLGAKRILLVFNKALGFKEKLLYGFGLQQKIFYSLREEDPERAEARHKLARNLVQALRAIFAGAILNARQR